MTQSANGKPRSPRLLKATAASPLHLGFHRIDLRDIGEGALDFRYASVSTRWQVARWGIGRQLQLGATASDDFHAWKRQVLA